MPGGELLCFVLPGERIPLENKVNSAGLVRVVGAMCLVAGFVVSCLGQGGAAVPRDKQAESTTVLEQEGKFAEAEAVWKSILSREPNNYQVYAHIGLLEARQEHYKEAIGYYRKALRLNPNMPTVKLDLGLSLFKAGDLRGAIQTFEPLVKAESKGSPERLRLVTLIGLANYGLGQYAAAVPYLKEAAASDAGNLPMRMALAQSCMNSKQYQCVLDVYKEILAINPDSAEADVLAGEAYDELKNDAGALEQFQAAVKADPKLPNVHFGYGYLLWKGQKLDEAAEQFRLELANNPDSALALTYLGDTELKLNHPDQALPHLEHALRIQTSIALTHLDLGIAYENQGKKDEALRELKTAEQLSPTDSQVHWHLGRLYQAMGQKEEARAEFEKTRNLQNAAQESVREKMHQVGTASVGQSDGAPSK